MKRAAWGAVVLVLLLAVVGGWLLSSRPAPATQPRAVVPVPKAAPPPAQRVLSAQALKPKPRPRVEQGCATSGHAAFVPTSIAVDHVTSGATVLALPRDATGTPGTPPLSSTGKHQFAWDAPGVRPGSRAGTVFLDAHTWPDGSALGNALLAGLRKGGMLRVHGPGTLLCYRVFERLEVPATRAPLDRVYTRTGPPALALVVCSGRRLGPGNWENRTIWFSRPV